MQPLSLFPFVCFALSIKADPDPSPKIEISTLVDCQDQKVPPPDGFACETEIVDHSLNANVSIPFDIDDSIQYQCSVKKWVDGQWQPIQFKLAGSVCRDVPKYLPGLWEKLSKAAKVSQNCPIKTGSYSVEGFTAEPGDVKLPFVVVGKYLVSALVLKNDTPLVCKQSELTISKA